MRKPGTAAAATPRGDVRGEDPLELARQLQQNIDLARQGSTLATQRLDLASNLARRLVAILTPRERRGAQPQNAKEIHDGE